MKIHRLGFSNKLGKVLAKPLSILVGNSMTSEMARMVEAYWCILLGKGAGSGRAMEAEISTARHAIKTPFPIIFDVGANTGEWAFGISRVLPD